MAYFLKKTKNKKGLYLQIYESFYDPKRGHTAHKSFKPIGYVHELQENGMEDPISFYGEEVKKLNERHKKEKLKDKERQIDEDSPEKYLGYFPLKNINDSLGCKKYLDVMQTATSMQFNIFEMLSDLIYARALFPCSKAKTHSEVLPKLFESHKFSQNQIYAGLEYMGLECEKIIEIYTEMIREKFPVDTSTTYFDCTNFYFEIDREDDFRRKGPSKENRHEPLVGLGLLLDANQVPVGMNLYPGNESEKPVLRSMIDDLKKRHQISGRTIQVADKGLNSASNIFEAVKSGDGYIFSKSVKMLPDTEKTWVLLDNDYVDVKNSEGKLLYRIKECIDDFPYTITENGKKRTVKLREKRIVTFNPSLAEKQRFEIRKQVEKAQSLRLSAAKRSEYGDCAKFVCFVPREKEGSNISQGISVKLNHKAISNALTLAGYNMIVTSEIHISANNIYSSYHNLWRIEESFRIMKSQLDARPVYLQKRETITGHFLVCYLTVLLTKLLQIHVLGDRYSASELFKFMRDFRLAQISDRKYINLAKSCPFIRDFSKITGLPLTKYFFSKTDIKKVLCHRF